MPRYLSRFVSIPGAPEFNQPAQSGPFSLCPKHIGSLLRQRGVNIDATAICGDVPRICYTWVYDESGYGVYRDLTEQEQAPFMGAIRIGEGSLLESNADRPPFHNGTVKLTSVRANEQSAGQIIIGRSVQLFGTAIVAYQRVEIEDEVGFGPMVTIMDCDGHTKEGRGQADEIARLQPQPVLIKRGSWIGAGAWIMKGVTIGEGAVVGANAVVIKDVPAGAVVMGNPARIVSRADS